MNCVKSWKRDMLVTWGMKQIDQKKLDLKGVRQVIRKMMRKTTEEVTVFVHAESK